MVENRKGRKGRKANFTSIHFMLDSMLGAFHRCGSPLELAFSLAGEASLGGRW